MKKANTIQKKEPLRWKYNNDNDERWKAKGKEGKKNPQTRKWPYQDLSFSLTHIVSQAKDEITIYSFFLWQNTTRTTSYIIVMSSAFFHHHHHREAVFLF